MDFRFTEEQEKLRKEIHDFYANELPQDFEVGELGPQGVDEESQSFWKKLQKKAGERGYLSTGWPKEYGGLGFSAIEQGINAEVVADWGVSWPDGVGLGLVGPAVILFGTEEQKKRVVPPIARGEVVCFECFTEPEAGSDAANIQLRAVQDGDDFILNGQKRFITGAYEPDWLYTQTRTADTTPKHRGISLFLIPADLPGITYRPLPGGSGSPQNEIFFDDVRVSKEYLLGELNRGFYHGMSTFEFERGGTGSAARLRRDLEEFVQFCRESKRNGKPLIEDPEVRDALAQMAVEVDVWRLISWHGQWWFGQRQKLGPKPFDLTGFFFKVFAVRHAEVMMNIMGTYGQLKQGSKWARLAGRIERNWLAMRSLHGGGTFEIYKNVLAQRGLGLPRIPAELNQVIMQALQKTGDR